jgi:hypothetical protein
MPRNPKNPRNPLTVESANTAADYAKLPTDLGGIVCTKCTLEIKCGQPIYALNFGIESSKLPMAEYLRFTGLIWHRRCLDVTTLPGMEGRDAIDDERPPMPSAQSKMTH